MPFPTWSVRGEHHPSTLSVGALSVGVLLVVTLAAQLARPAPPAPVDHGGPLTPPPAPTPPSITAPDYPRILARPLFAPARGAAGADDAAQAASTSLSDYTLVGVVSVAGRAEAILRGPADQIVGLRAGQALLGWQVATIGRAGVVLRRGDDRRVVAVSSTAGPKMDTR